MKRSLRVQLVLITAALASCSRVWVPARSLNDNLSDTISRAITPPCETDSCFCPCEPCDDPSMMQLWSYAFDPFGVYYWPAGSWYFPDGIRRKGTVWRNSHAIVRGGLGKSVHAAGA
ncbi:MAG TPA: hypothetical protein VGM30_16835 [Puia sp.]|jgi:hypothetical protein